MRVQIGFNDETSKTADVKDGSSRAKIADEKCFIEIGFEMQDVYYVLKGKNRECSQAMCKR